MTHDLNPLQTSLSRRSVLAAAGAASIAPLAAALAPHQALAAESAEAAGSLPEVLYSKSVTADALYRIYDRLGAHLEGRIGIKIHGSEARINYPLFLALQQHVPESCFIETCWSSDFGGARRHVAGTIRELRSQDVEAPVDVLDRDENRPESYVSIPVPEGAELKEIEVCRAMLEDYGGIVVLSNFKIPSFAGFTGATKNIGIGLVSREVRQSAAEEAVGGMIGESRHRAPLRTRRSDRRHESCSTC